MQPSRHQHEPSQYFVKYELSVTFVNLQTIEVNFLLKKIELILKYQFITLYLPSPTWNTRNF